MITALKLKYHVSDYYFRDTVTNMLGQRRLEDLHKASKYPNLITRELDQSSKWHSAFYKGWKGGIEEAYHNFIEWEIEPKFGRVVFQRVPTFRVQFPDNLAVGDWHRDRDYGHDPREITIWLPLTEVDYSTSILYEAYLKQHYFLMNYGEYLIIDTANLKHGNVPNCEKYTRVSMDFRIIPDKLYEAREADSVNTHMKFKLGEYFDRLY